MAVDRGASGGVRVVDLDPAPRVFDVADGARRLHAVGNSVAALYVGGDVLAVTPDSGAVTIDRSRWVDADGTSLGSLSPATSTDPIVSVLVALLAATCDGPGPALAEADLRHYLRRLAAEQGAPEPDETQIGAVSWSDVVTAYAGAAAEPEAETLRWLIARGGVPLASQVLAADLPDGE